MGSEVDIYTKTYSYSVEKGSEDHKITTDVVGIFEKGGKIRKPRLVTDPTFCVIVYNDMSFGDVLEFFRKIGAKDGTVFDTLQYDGSTIMNMDGFDPETREWVKKAKGVDGKDDSSIYTAEVDGQEMVKSDYLPPMFGELDPEFIRQVSKSKYILFTWDGVDDICEGAGLQYEQEVFIPKTGGDSDHELRRKSVSYMSHNFQRDFLDKFLGSSVFTPRKEEIDSIEEFIVRSLKMARKP